MNPARIEELLGQPAPDEATYRSRFDPEAEAQALRTAGHLALHPGQRPRRVALAAAAMCAVVVGALLLSQTAFNVTPFAGPTSQPLACGATMTVQPSLLRPLAAASLDPGALAAFEDELRTLTGRLPGTGWELLEATSSRVVLVAPGPTRSTYVYVELSRTAGAWSAVAFGDCNRATGGAIAIGRI